MIKFDDEKMKKKTQTRCRRTRETKKIANKKIEALNKINRMSERRKRKESMNARACYKAI